MLAENNSVLVVPMLGYPIPANETQRLATLYQLKLLDTPDDPVFDRATRLLNVPIATVTLIDADPDWRDVILCQHQHWRGKLTPRRAMKRRKSC